MTEELAIRFPLSLEIALFSTLTSTLIAIPLGTLAAICQDTWVDYGVRGIGIGGRGIPVLWTGILLILFLVIYFEWSPRWCSCRCGSIRRKISSNWYGPSSRWATAMPR